MSEERGNEFPQQTGGKIIYVASPYAGDVEQNLAFVKAACLDVIGQGHTPIAVHLLYPQFLDDNSPVEREIGLQLGRNILRCCDELWAYGGRISTGMQAEIAAAQAMGIPVQYVPELQQDQCRSIQMK